MKPNYRFERAERARSKEAKKIQKREALAARRQNAPATAVAAETESGTAAAVAADAPAASEHVGENPD